MDKETILEKYDKITDYHMGAGITLEDAKFAIQEYADQQTKHLTEQLEKELNRNDALKNLNNTLSESLKLKTEIALELDKSLKENGNLTEQLAEKEKELSVLTELITDSFHYKEIYSIMDAYVNIKTKLLTEQLAEANGCIKIQARIYHEQVKELAEKEKEIEKLKRRIIALEKQMAENI